MVSYIQRVSLTGPDDQTDISKLIDLAARYPFVEWALLYVPHNEGAPRNPTKHWRQAFFKHLAHQSAVHLCGELAFRQLLSNDLPEDILVAPRLQLNINARRREFTDDEVIRVYSRALAFGPDIILQYHPGTAASIERFIQQVPAAHLDRVHVLLDSSLGLGRAPDKWACPETLKHRYVGFAGGISPDNINAVVTAVEGIGMPCWIDMESGIRTDNQLDAAKAEIVLKAVFGHDYKERVTVL